jgi:hypothetical protein
MRSSFVAEAGLPVVRTPSARQQAVRRRLAVAGTILGLALFSALLGVFAAPRASEEAPGRTGPFSYFPSE